MLYYDSRSKYSLPVSRKRNIYGKFYIFGSAQYEPPNNRDGAKVIVSVSCNRWICHFRIPLPAHQLALKHFACLGGKTNPTMASNPKSMAD